MPLQFFPLNFLVMMYVSQMQVLSSVWISLVRLKQPQRIRFLQWPRQVWEGELFQLKSTRGTHNRHFFLPRALPKLGISTPGSSSGLLKNLLAFPNVCYIFYFPNTYQIFDLSLSIWLSRVFLCMDGEWANFTIRVYLRCLWKAFSFFLHFPVATAQGLGILELLCTLLEK